MEFKSGNEAAATRRQLHEEELAPLVGAVREAIAAWEADPSNKRTHVRVPLTGPLDAIYSSNHSEVRDALHGWGVTYEEGSANWQPYERQPGDKPQPAVLYLRPEK